MKVAISGKGGTGKTTIAGTLARAFGRIGYSVLAIDADSNPNLALTLGVPRDQATQLSTVPHDLVKQVIDPVGGHALQLAMSLEEITETYGLKIPDGVTLLVMGRVDHAGTG